MQRLNWGCAFDVREGWVNSDLVDYGQEHVGDLLEGLPYSEGFFRVIVANHALQMVRFDDIPRALAELRRVLVHNGTLRILVPDFQRAIKHYVDGDADYFPIADELTASLDGKLLRYIFWHGDARSAFTAESLREALLKAEFQDVQVVNFKQTSSDVPGITDLDSRETESLVVEARK